MKLGEWMKEHGLSSEDVAARLEEHGVTKTTGQNVGQTNSPQDVTRRRGSEVPRAWLAALGLEDAEPEERAPKPPPGAKIQPPALDPDLLAQSPKRIAGIYRFLGAALASGAENEGIAVIFDDQADPIAELWVKAAQENPWAARFVNVVNAGGSVGDLAAAHLYLLGAVAYVVGAGVPAGEHLYPKYSRYRVVVPQKTEGAERNGATDAAEGAVGDARRADRQ